MTEHDERVGPRRRGPLAAWQPAAAVLATGTAVAFAFVAAGCSGADAPRAGTPPSFPQASPPTRPGEPPPRSLAPNPVKPERAVDLRRVRWQRSQAVPGRPEVRIHATLEGGPPCTVLGRVEVRETAGAVTITLWAGRRAGARCGERRSLVGFPIVLTVALSRPVGDRAVRDGAADEP